MSGHHSTTDYRFAPVPEDLLWDTELDATSVRVYVTLMRHGLDPASCYPSHARIAELIGVSARSVARPLKRLEERGWISRTERFSDRGDRLANGYHVHVSRVEIESGDAQESAPPAQENVDPPTREDATPPRSEARTGEREQEEREKEQRDATGAQVDAPEDTAADPGRPAPDGAVVDRDHPAYGFERWWKNYPPRNGKKVGKEAALVKWRKLNYASKAACFRATQRYATACAAGHTIAKDPPRFLSSGYWKDWVEGDTVADRPERSEGTSLDSIVEMAGIR